MDHTLFINAIYAILNKTLDKRLSGRLDATQRFHFFSATVIAKEALV